ncbi:MAG: hypothetical protein PHS73_05265 [Candidatus Peribacteraceae bacterium]|nr:hypothetical protein [Candidatus Peribacteraceae bacterium]
MKRKFILAAALVIGTLSARSALAYTSPEEVLLNRELYLPPSTRGVEDRIDRQAEESAARRAREQEILFKAQQSSSAATNDALHPSAGGEGTATALDPTALTTDDLELLRTLRLLNRVDQNQRVLQYGGRTLEDPLHPGAPLAPTGLPGVVAATVMVGAAVWTIRRAQKARRMTRIGE